MKGLFFLIMFLLSTTEYLDKYANNDVFKMCSMTFCYIENENSDVPNTLIEQISQALEQDLIEDFLKQNEAEYRIIPVDEQQGYAEKEKTGMLKMYQEKYADEADIWFEIGTPELYYVIRQRLEDENYLYYQFFYEKGFKAEILLEKAYAWGKGEDFYFIEWDDKVYLTTTNRDENGINGVAVYCCLNNKSGRYGGMVYLEKKQGEIYYREYALSTTGTGIRGPGWVEY